MSAAATPVTMARAFTDACSAAAPFTAVRFVRRMAHVVQTRPALQIRHPYYNEWMEATPETRRLLRVEYDLCTDEELQRAAGMGAAGILGEME